MADTQTAAVIGTTDSEGARASIPLLNAAGFLHVSLGAGYPGFTARVGPTSRSAGTPPSARKFARLVGDDRAQARALVRAAGARRSWSSPRAATTPPRSRPRCGARPRPRG